MLIIKIKLPSSADDAHLIQRFPHKETFAVKVSWSQDAGALWVNHFYESLFLLHVIPSHLIKNASTCMTDSLRGKEKMSVILINFSFRMIFDVEKSQHDHGLKADKLLCHVIMWLAFKDCRYWARSEHQLVQAHLQIMLENETSIKAWDWTKSPSKTNFICKVKLTRADLIASKYWIWENCHQSIVITLVFHL